MRLKIATTAFLLFGLALLASWPWVVGPRPAHGAPRVEIAGYATRLMAYMGGTILSFVTAALLAIFVMRRAREAYRSEAKHNLAELLEGTRRDHGRKRT